MPYFEEINVEYDPGTTTTVTLLLPALCDDVEAIVLKIDRENEKFSLGIKQLTQAKADWVIAQSQKRPEVTDEDIATFQEKGRINPETGEIDVYAIRKVVDTVTNPVREISLEDPPVHGRGDGSRLGWHLWVTLRARP